MPLWHKALLTESKDPFSFPAHCLPGTQEEAGSSQTYTQTGQGAGQVQKASGMEGPGFKRGPSWEGRTEGIRLKKILKK